MKGILTDTALLREAILAQLKVRPMSCPYMVGELGKGMLLRERRDLFGLVHRELRSMLKEGLVQEDLDWRTRSWTSTEVSCA
jgi:hypothetical protein